MNVHPRFSTSSRLRTRLFAAIAMLIVAATVNGQPRRVEKASFFTVADRASYAPGSTVNLAAAVSVDPGWHVNSNKPTFDYLIPTTLVIDSPAGWPHAEISYPEGIMQTFAFAEEPISVYDGQFILLASLVLPDDEERPSVSLRTTLRYQACDDRSCLPPVLAESVVELRLGEDGERVNGEYFDESAAAVESAGHAGPPAPQPTGFRRLLSFLGLGILGGLLLNAMPCVLPVLSLKILGLVKSRAQGRAHVVSGSLATALGILVSFWALALAAIVARFAGATVGWGVQFQEPTFVTFLTVVVLLFCLNLWGVFEVPLPAKVANWAASTGGEGLPGHFTAGLFATLLATPCSAPFLGTALGFALSQSSSVVLATFTAVGVGMALPYLLLALTPGAVRILPKPGPWMDRFRSFMGFLLASAAIWLLYVLSSQVSRERLAFIELTLLLVALFIWMRSRSTRGSFWAATGLIGLVLSTGGALILSATSEIPGSTSTSEVVHLIDWVRFDRLEAESLAAEGTLVFVDVTADWCFTCKVNEKLVLETPEIADLLARFDVVPMKADWTNRNEEIADFLASHGKYGIPFYLLYRPDREPHLFSELLTKEAVVSAVTDAAGDA